MNTLEIIQAVSKWYRDGNSLGRAPGKGIVYCALNDNVRYSCSIGCLLDIFDGMLLQEAAESLTVYGIKPLYFALKYNKRSSPLYSVAIAIIEKLLPVDIMECKDTFNTDEQKLNASLDFLDAVQLIHDRLASQTGVLSPGQLDYLDAELNKVHQNYGGYTGYVTA